MSSACVVTEDTRATGEYLRRLRDDAGLSQRELARLLGCQQPAIARLEAGGVRPGLTTLQRIGDALGFELQIHMVSRDDALNAGVPVALHGRS
jgi:transcriptional regulator with XRE-family HTH domain